MKKENISYFLATKSEYIQSGDFHAENALIFKAAGTKLASRSREAQWLPSSGSKTTQPISVPGFFQNCEAGAPQDRQKYAGQKEEVQRKISTGKYFPFFGGISNKNV